jgi:hypothetical protein
LLTGPDAGDRDAHDLNRQDVESSDRLSAAVLTAPIPSPIQIVIAR